MSDGEAQQERRNERGEKVLEKERREDHKTDKQKKEEKEINFGYYFNSGGNKA